MIYMTEEVPAEVAASDVRRHQWEPTPEDRAGDDQ